jgi:hypothetical protein
MSTPPAQADYRGFGLATFLLGVAGWAGLAYLITQAVPTTQYRWLFFVVIVAALTGTAAPFVHFLNRRFARLPPPAVVLLRQSLWLGFYGATCAWLQLGRTLTLPMAGLLAATMLAVEWVLRVRERSRWTPGRPSNPQDEPA